MKLKFHPAAGVWNIKDEDVERLAESIKEQGQLEPVRVSSDGRIVDGRSRYLACEKLGIEPKIETLPEMSELDLWCLASAYANRRDPTQSQRACAAAEFWKEFPEPDRQGKGGGRPRKDGKETSGMATGSYSGETRERIGARFKVSGKMVDMARQILANSPSAFSTVKAGDEPLTVVFDMWKKGNEEAKRKIADVEADINAGVVRSIRNSYPDLADQIEAGKLSVAKGREEMSRRIAEAEEAKRDANKKFGLITAMFVFSKKWRGEMETFDTDRVLSQIGRWQIADEAKCIEELIEYLQQLHQTLKAYEDKNES